MKLERDLVNVGDQVKVVGRACERGGNELFITNMLLPRGLELAFDPGAKPKWADSTEGDSSIWLVTDPKTFTEPVTFSKQWLRVAGAAVRHMTARLRV